MWHSALQNELNINGLSKYNGSIAIMLHSIDGKRIIDEKISGNNNSNTIKLPTIDITAGVYILIIESDTYSYTTKFCIEN
ncbi:T9SS type A sorting domain-containing protein [uncultured Winogradskyella sp.]|uniref:T9SS type A sorting domain-containing protein n=1 Tax=uncultured Winogradskyella sp. TaxID=395353 RepID=UPI0026088148|nr:T9SS type A sorting domain-containing protein [uncultured Winogradskyella sp.]